MKEITITIIPAVGVGVFKIEGQWVLQVPFALITAWDKA